MDSIIDKRNRRGGLASPKVKGGYGMRDFYKFYCESGGTLSYSKYSTIMRQANTCLTEELLKNAEDYILPHGIGTVSFRKRKNKTYVSKGNILTTAQPDWTKTLKLWEENSQAKRNKILVRYTNVHTGRYSFRVKLFARKFKNKEYFAFKYNRSFKRRFAERIFDYSKANIETQIEKNI